MGTRRDPPQIREPEEVERSPGGRVSDCALALEITDQDEPCDDDQHREGEETNGANIRRQFGLTAVCIVT
jgi:hypothetical protein